MYSKNKKIFTLVQNSQITFKSVSFWGTLTNLYWGSWSSRVIVPTTVSVSLGGLADLNLKSTDFVSYRVMYLTSFLPNYYFRNENIWLDGFLFDFLQKKSVDSWVRRFVIYTGFLFSERLVFDTVIKLYIDNILFTLSRLSIFEVNNVSELIVTTLFLFLTLFILLTSTYLLLL